MFKFNEDSREDDFLKDLNINYDQKEFERFDGVDDPQNATDNSVNIKNKRINYNENLSNKTKEEIADEIRKSAMSQIKDQLKKSGLIQNDEDFDENKIRFQKITNDNSNKTQKKSKLSKLNDLNELDSIKDFTKVFSKLGTSVNYKEISKVIPWFKQYSKQPIAITEDKVRAYLKNFFSLDDLIKMRTNKILNGEVEPESKIVNFNDITDFSFLEELDMTEGQFKVLIDYKIYEMKFYRKYLLREILNLKKFLFSEYQFVVVKYFLNLSDDQIRAIIATKNIKNIDLALITFLCTKLEEEAKQECQI